MSQQTTEERAWLVFRVFLWLLIQTLWWTIFLTQWGMPDWWEIPIWFALSLCLYFVFRPLRRLVRAVFESIREEARR